MNTRAIIGEAWQLTQENKSLIWFFAFAPALISTLISIAYMVYQAAAFWTSPYFNPGRENEAEAFTLILRQVKSFFDSSPGFTVFLLALLAIVGVVYLMLPVFTQGALIQLIARIRGGHKLSIVEGISLGFRRFLQLFEYHLLIKSFSLVSILSNAAFILRSLGPEAFAVLGWLFLLAFCVGLVLSLLFTYSEYFLLIDDKGVFASMSHSSGLVVRHWHHTLLIFLLMAIISLRIFINILAAIFIPLIVLLPILFFANLTYIGIGLFIGLGLGLVALYFTSYFVGVFHVFSAAVWTFTFLELSSAKHDLNFRENG